MTIQPLEHHIYKFEITKQIYTVFFSLMKWKIGLDS